MVTTEATVSPLFVWRFSGRKVAILRKFMPASRIVVVRRLRAVPAGSTLLLWGGEPRPAGLANNVRCMRVEDGFLRSVGLGADLVQPLSWVFDGRGIYFDALHPSDLEVLLQTDSWSPEQLARAADLRQRIVAAGLTKYNVGCGRWRRPESGQRVLLVPGQVESDASIRQGAVAICTNLALLRAVKQGNPDAFVLYKPHPDVLAGLRAKGSAESEALTWCDEVVTDVPMTELLPEIDEVHTLTSLTGFEALLRGKIVHCYGQPFYAGWGLTVDKYPHPRRQRVLTLDQLVYGVLISYPRYTNRSGKRIGPEEAVDELLRWRNEPAATPWWRTGMRRVLRALLWMRGKS